MAASWYKIFNLPEFLATGILSRTLVLEIETLGPQTFEVFKGNYVSVLYADAFLPIDFLEQNPYAQGSYAIYKDDADDVWIGIEDDA